MGCRFRQIRPSWWRRGHPYPVGTSTAKGQKDFDCRRRWDVSFSSHSFSSKSKSNFIFRVMYRDFSNFDLLYKGIAFLSWFPFSRNSSIDCKLRMSLDWLSPIRSRTATSLPWNETLSDSRSCLTSSPSSSKVMVSFSDNVESVLMSFPMLMIFFQFKNSLSLLFKYDHQKLLRSLFVEKFCKQFQNFFFVNDSVTLPWNCRLVETQTLKWLGV